jgi:hypothetical protein
MVVAISQKNGQNSAEGQDNQVWVYGPHRLAFRRGGASTAERGSPSGISKCSGGAAACSTSPDFASLDHRPASIPLR